MWLYYNYVYNEWLYIRLCVSVLFKVTDGGKYNIYVECSFKVLSKTIIFISHIVSVPQELLYLRIEFIYVNCDCGVCIQK